MARARRRSAASRCSVASRLRGAAESSIAPARPSPVPTSPHWDSETAVEPAVGGAIRDLFRLA